MNGGYVMVDCKGMVFAEGISQTISGLFAKCVEAMESGKPILMCNCFYDDFKLSPIPVYMQKGPTFCSATTPGPHIMIDKSDSVTISFN